MLPAITCDISVVLATDTDDENIGDIVRSALHDRVEAIESIQLLSRTDYDELPARPQQRLDIPPGQVNCLVRLTLWPVARTLTDPKRTPSATTYSSPCTMGRFSNWLESLRQRRWLETRLILPASRKGPCRIYTPMNPTAP